MDQTPSLLSSSPPLLNQLPCLASNRKFVRECKSLFLNALKQTQESCQSISEQTMRCIHEISTFDRQFLTNRTARQEEIVDLASRIASLCTRVSQLRDQVPLRKNPKSILSSFLAVQDLEIKAYLIKNALPILSELYNNVEFKEAFEEYLSCKEACMQYRKNPHIDITERKEKSVQMRERHKSVMKHFSTTCKIYVEQLHEDINALFQHTLQEPQKAAVDDLTDALSNLAIAETSLPSSYVFSNSKYFAWWSSYHKLGIKIQNEVAMGLYSLYSTLHTFAKSCSFPTSDEIQGFERKLSYFSHKLTALRSELISLPPTDQIAEGLQYIFALREHIVRTTSLLDFLKLPENAQCDSFTTVVKSLIAFLQSLAGAEETIKLSSLSSLAVHYSTVACSSEDSFIQRTLNTVSRVLTTRGSLLVSSCPVDDELRRAIVAEKDLQDSNGQLVSRIKLYLMRQALNCLYYTKEHSDANFNLALLSLGNNPCYLESKRQDPQFSSVIDLYRTFNLFNIRIDILELFPTIFRLLDQLEKPDDVGEEQTAFNFLEVSQLLSDVDVYKQETARDFDQFERRIQGAERSLNEITEQIRLAQESITREETHKESLREQAILNKKDHFQLNLDLEDVQQERMRIDHALQNLIDQRKSISEVELKCRQYESSIRLLRTTRQTDVSDLKEKIDKARKMLSRYGDDSDLREKVERECRHHESSIKLLLELPEPDVSPLKEELDAARKELSRYGSDSDFRELDRNITDLKSKAARNDADITSIMAQISHKQREAIQIQLNLEDSDKKIVHINHDIKNLQIALEEIVRVKESHYLQQPKVSQIITHLFTLACSRYSKLEYKVETDKNLVLALSQVLYSKNSRVQESGQATIISHLRDQSYVMNSNNLYLILALQIYALKQFCKRTEFFDAHTSLSEAKILVFALYRYVTEEKWRTLLIQKFTLPVLEHALYRLITLDNRFKEQLNGTQEVLNALPQHRNSEWVQLMQKFSEQPVTPLRLQQLLPNLECLLPVAVAGA